MSLNLFARLTKVDEEHRLVYGRATDETVDRAGEIFDYATSKPYFEKWSGDIAKATDGKSVGNLRAMHGSVAAGKLTSIDFNDEEKAIDICTKIVDDNEWGKVLEGVYTGFSIGGSYRKTWTDTTAKARRFTADPCEISIVDLPCNPSAGFFDIQKADGSVMQKAFKAPAMTTDSFSDEVAELAKSGELSMTEMLAAIRKAKDDKKKPYGDVEYADPKNEKYPIDTEEHIRAAWSYINQKKNADEYSADELAEVKDRIVAAWKKEIDKDGPPSADDADKAARVVMSKGGKPVNLAPANLLKAGHLAMAKGMPTCANLAYLLQSILCLSESVQAEEAREGDTASTLPDGVKEWLKQGGDLLVAMVTEEVAELTGPDGDIDGPDVCYVMCAAAVEGLEKAAAAAGGDRREFLQKVGARNSAADKDRIQQAHDLMSDLGAACCTDGDANKSAAAQLQKAASDLDAANVALVKVADERDALAKSATDLAAERDDLKKRHDELTNERDALTKTVDEQAEKITKLSAQPAQSKGVLKAVDKSHDLIESSPEDGDVQPVLKQDGSVDAIATAIKKARRAGGVVVRPL